ncbi:class I adenylate-forming enzyme family protein [Georgenia sp. SYP-B2076]|uniref:class I adenylate-forming enzyme family protein n=1 Tax=Georgenia sp. SYP-B2076 TaxID=2495881 RepID=UPI000F8D489F|nr:AMP-binding protein [Georgenia sp. SYP-B2076]
MSVLAPPAGEPGPHTLGRWTRDRARLTPHKVAVDERGTTLTYAELDARALALAERLLRAGYVRGDRVATLTRNSADHVVLFFACAKAGLVLTPMSWRLAAEELAYQLRHARPALVLVQAALAGAARAALAHLDAAPPVELLGPDGVELHVPGPARTDGAAPEPHRAVADDDPLLLVYTSGTARAPKGVLLTHANCFWTNLSLSGGTGMTSQDVVLSVLPQFHVGGWNIQPLLAWWTGATVLLEPELDAARMLELLADRGVTTMMGVPTVYQLLADHPGFDGTDLSSLTHAVVGGAPMPEALLHRWRARGVRIIQGYGLTEASPNVLALPPGDAPSRIGWVGKPYPHVDVAVADPATGALLHGPAQGELLVRGPAVFAGYFRDPEATAAAVVDGWLRTGDLVERDAEGYFRVVDRLDDMYISGGENISPAEVEQALGCHPGVAEVAVVGVPDRRWGQVGHAFVVRAPGSAVSEEELMEHCRTRLAAFKAPRSVGFVDRLPRTALHKVQRGALPPVDGAAPADAPRADDGAAAFDGPATFDGAAVPVEATAVAAPRAVAGDTGVPR